VIIINERRTGRQCSTATARGGAIAVVHLDAAGRRLEVASRATGVCVLEDNSSAISVVSANRAACSSQQSSAFKERQWLTVAITGQLSAPGDKCPATTFCVAEAQIGSGARRAGHDEHRSRDKEQTFAKHG